MNTPPDLAARLDRALGDPPPAAPAEDPRTAGQRALRRRRTATAGVVAAAVATGAVVTVLAGGAVPTGHDPTQVADRPAPAPAPATSATPPPETSSAAPVATPAPIVRLTEVPTPDPDPAGMSKTRLRDDLWVDFRTDGTLELLPDATILQRIDDPVATDLRSVALELSRPGRPVAWYLVELIPGYEEVPTSTTIPAGSGGYASLQAWVDAIGGPVDPAPR